MHQKFTIVTQQCFNRLHNTSEEVDDKVKVDILNEFMQELKESEYTETDREIILKGAINTYINLKIKEMKGVRPFYRDNYFEKSQRKFTKDSKKKNWFKGKYSDSKFKSETLF